jgi:hypothetical protein
MGVRGGDCYVRGLRAHPKDVWIAEGAFHQTVHRRLMSGMALQRRSHEERVCELDIAMQEDPVPRDQDVMEYG